MKYAVLFCLIILSCTDDRPLNYEDLEARPVFEFNVFQTRYSASLINAGNQSVPVPNSLRDFVDLDFFNEDFNENLVSLEFKFLAENSIDRIQQLDFIFYDANARETFRISEPIAAGAEGNPSTQEFSVVLNPLEIAQITSSVRAELLINQASSATNSGEMRLECIVEAGYLFSAE
ncbi:hypothetical protein G3567_10015 [Psychroflexus sp. YR1-1]|uniref:Uncharacterized protein n=1 Tax=Psychroflexus aurantiacus TaxID=2709310 RepID=A0A6B3R1F9_9FLAO|nr:hypothetical protein [Psychroflexus aurantiacus]NEV94476.1 hypothetical protein [Psychroflexus aurantiacus]